VAAEVLWPDAPAPAALAPPKPFSMRAWLLCTWWGGAAAILAFRLLGSSQLRRLGRASGEDPEAQALVEGWSKVWRLRRRVRVRRSDEITVPMTWGTLRPIIMLPAAGDENTAALQHEFAHVRRHDAARRWLGTVVLALWWPHPLVWRALLAWKLEQERACDDAVLNHGGDPSAYARQLLEAARGRRLSRFQSAAALVMAMPGGLEERLRSVVSPRVNRLEPRRATLLRIGALALIAGFAGVAFQAQPIAAAPPEPAPVSKAELIRKQAEETIIPLLALQDRTLQESLEEVARLSGLKISYAPKAPNEGRITVNLRTIPVSEALRYVTELANASFTYGDDGVQVHDAAAASAAPASPLLSPRHASLVPRVPAPTAPLFVKEWKVAPGFLNTLPGAAGLPPPRGGAGQPRDAHDYLAAAGIDFPPGSAATFDAVNSRLTMRNTQANLDALEHLVEKSINQSLPPSPAR
jgi:beta-lactamase regulating signal transducer with metallopeptidase domain